MKFIKDFLHNREINKIKKRIDRLQEQAVHFQRNGNLRQYATIMGEIEELSNFLIEKIDEKVKTDSKTVDNSNFVDYDGMGNQGRFPSTNRGD